MEITEKEIEEFEKTYCGKCNLIHEVERQSPVAPRVTELACADDPDCLERNQFGEVVCKYREMEK